MNQRLEDMKRRVRAGEHKRFRQNAAPDVLTECDAEDLSWSRRVARLTHRMCEAEQPVIDLDERIVFTRTLPTIPPIFSPQDWERQIENRTLHELGPINNICPDWGAVLSQGLIGRKQVALETRDRMVDDAEAIEFLDCAVETIDAVLDLAKRYAEAAKEKGRDDIAEVLNHVPAYQPRTFHEALQSLRLLHAVIWLSGHYQVGLGRFDQYMWPYLHADLDAGRLDMESAEELLAEFFVALNKDSDLFPYDPGDNGQTLILGGVRRDGSDGVNELTRMALRVALETSMIDPKINLRISPDTHLDLLCLATELTSKGLGFPQYSNDAVVIPALVANGYEIEDARDYTVAACWEFIIPGQGMEIVNIGAVSLPAAADRAIREGLTDHRGFDQILDRVAQEIQMQLDDLVDVYSRVVLPPAPYFSVLMDGCLERGQDLSRGLKYNGFGIHGAASSDAADALAAVKKFIFEEGSVDAEELLRALDANFEGYESLRQKLSSESPQVGNNDDDADTMVVKLLEFLADAAERIEDNGRGGRVRPGTGSAMYYVWLARGHEGMHEPVVGATADGRRAGDFFSANLSPSHNAQVRGPISVLQSFGKIDYSRVYNGGPITMELSDAVFRDPESIRKVAMLVRTFAQIGCQQLQLNTLNIHTLLDAKKHPEKHRDLIVRVWGWSGYFCELAPEYQDHVITRHVYAMG